jgi:predicted lipoprotein
MVSSFIKGLDTPQRSRRLSGRVVAEGTRTNINIYVHMNGNGVYLRIQCKVTYHF